MAKTRILDCTLRDGGYCNQWMFREENIGKIIASLVDAGINVVEMGFITNRVAYNKDASKYPSFAAASAHVPQDKEGRLFVCMINYGEFDVRDIPQAGACRLDGIRLAFHKKDADAALHVCEEIQKKGFKVFIQAMVSLNYSDEEFIELIRKVNSFSPFAFYIVDSFGSMTKSQLIRYYYLAEHNLNAQTMIGFHSHNNLQLSLSHAQTLAELPSKRDILIDTSVFGMGRGAGNLNTELFIRFLNTYSDSSYSIKPILTTIDEIINGFYQKKPWGYTLPNYLSASHNLHPNYADYLSEKQTLTVEAIHDIFSMMDEDHKNVFDVQYIENLYLEYMASENTQESRLAELRETIAGKKILLIAPGKTTETEKEQIEAFKACNEVVTIGVNCSFDTLKTEFVFVSNLRRFRTIPPEDRAKCIVTSNIPNSDVFLKIKYKPLLNDVDFVKDNAGLMLIRFLIEQDVQEVYLAGFDGYSHDAEENYNNAAALVMQNALLDARNEGMKTMLARYGEQIRIRFITTTKYI